MRIGLTFNIKKTGSERESVFDSPFTIESIKKALESYGHRVKLYEASSETLYYLLSMDRPQIVFNVSEGRFGVYGESYVPAILDELKIPYTGSSPLASSLAVNKVATKFVLKGAGIRVPKLYQFITSKNEKIENIENFPVIVKPVFEGSSIGIYSKSVCYSYEEVIIAVKRIWDRLRRPVMIEEFIEGREVTVGVIGNFPPKALSPLEIDFSSLGRREARVSNGIQTFRFKTNYSEKASYHLPARFDESVLLEIQRTAESAFKVLTLRDVARFDIRVAKDNLPYIVEVNAVVGLEPEHSDLPRIYKMMGKPYEELINDILQSALERIKRAERANF